MAVGYSGTPLAKKLGIGQGARVLLRHAPPDYRTLLAPIPSGVAFLSKLSPEVGVVHVFATWKEPLTAELASLRSTVRPDAAVWVSWPKQASKVPTDVTEDVVRDLALPLGFVDVKVCAVSDVWSGLKLVIRKALR